jgi:hypothetical protein
MPRKPERGAVFEVSKEVSKSHIFGGSPALPRARQIYPKRCGAGFTFQKEPLVVV